MRRDHDGQHLRYAHRAKAGRGLERARDRMPVRLPQHGGLRLVLQRLELREFPPEQLDRLARRRGECARALRALLRLVQGHAYTRETARSEEALEPALHPSHIAGHHRVRPSAIAQRCEQACVLGPAAGFVATRSISPAEETANAVRLDSLDQRVDAAFV